MSRLMRMTYGHGGTRLERTLVSWHHQEPAPTPVRLKLLLLAIWIVIPALVSLYAIPKTSLPMKTVIDISRLSVKTLPEPMKPIIPETKPAPAVEQQLEAAPKPVTIQKLAVEPPRVRQAAVPQAEDVKHPSITRMSPAERPDLAEPKPLSARERKMINTEMSTTPAPRLRRGAVPAEAPNDRTSVSRSRGAVFQDEPGAGEHVAALRRKPAVEPSSTGSSLQQQRVARSERTYAPTEESAARTVTFRKRADSVAGETGQSTPSAGLIRGVSLMSLDICSSTRQQEEAIKAILAVVGSRQSCSNGKGEFQFKGTKRISSFNLLIFPSKGRRLSNRCEELEDAYLCLKNN